MSFVSCLLALHPHHSQRGSSETSTRGRRFTRTRPVRQRTRFTPMWAAESLEGEAPGRSRTRKAAQEPSLWKLRMTLQLEARLLTRGLRKALLGTTRFSSVIVTSHTRLEEVAHSSDFRPRFFEKSQNRLLGSANAELSS